MSDEGGVATRTGSYRVPSAAKPQETGHSRVAGRMVGSSPWLGGAMAWWNRAARKTWSGSGILGYAGRVPPGIEPGSYQSLAGFLLVSLGLLRSGGGCAAGGGRLELVPSVSTCF